MVVLSACLNTNRTLAILFNNFALKNNKTSLFIVVLQPLPLFMFIGMTMCSPKLVSLKLVKNEMNVKNVKLHF